MKRINNIFEKICSIENLMLADKKARKGKRHHRDVILHSKKQEENIISLHNLLLSGTYKTSPYEVFKIFDVKEREIYKLPYFPDRIVHHAIMNYLEPVFVDSFISQTYSCIKKRGIHAAARAIRNALDTDRLGTLFCLKLDIKKFYPSIKHEVLKKLLRKKIKDNKLLNLLYEIIDSAPGCPIGNYLSQYFANFYLTYFDHWLKEVKNVKYYFRYADDMVILSDSKEYLHALLKEISTYLRDNLLLQVKENHQIFPVVSRGIDFVGYKFYHTHTLLRKRIKKQMMRMVCKNYRAESFSSYNGWLMYCNSVNLRRKIFDHAT